jgi:hypothetical protein
MDHSDHRPRGQVFPGLNEVLSRRKHGRHVIDLQHPDPHHGRGREGPEGVAVGGADRQVVKLFLFAVQLFGDDQEAGLRVKSVCYDSKRLRMWQICLFYVDSVIIGEYQAFQS